MVVLNSRGIEMDGLKVGGAKQKAGLETDFNDAPPSNIGGDGMVQRSVMVRVVEEIFRKSQEVR